MLEGVFPPIPTPFVRGEFSAESLAGNMERWNEQPLDGYVVLGSNGEAPLLDESEREAVVRAVAGRIKTGRRLIVGAGRDSTRAT
ncbi:MAG: dihydrodipicolinate synthase family protein, partial [Acidobacteriota bacterium]